MLVLVLVCVSVQLSTTVKKESKINNSMYCALYNNRTTIHIYIYIYTVRQASLSHRQSLWNANKMAFHFISFWFGSFVVGFLSLALLAGAHMLMWWKLLSASLFDSLFSFSILLSMCIYIYLYFAFRPRKEKIMRTMFTPLRIRIRMHCIERVWCIDVICVHKM